MTPEISIIVPSFNEEKNISRCLNSLLSQNYQNFEIICVDNASTDSTFEIIKSFAEKDKRIKPFHIEEKGVSNARNFGIENSCGKYIGFIDADDFIQPQMYEFMIRAIEENQCDFVCCRYKKVDEINIRKFDFSCRKFRTDEFIDFTDKNFVSENELIISSACTKLIKKEFVGNFKKFKIGEDTVFCSELFKNHKNFVLVDLPLFCYYNNSESVSFTDLKSDKWFDLLVTRFTAFENFKSCNKKTSEFYLDRGMKNILSYRFNLNSNKYKKEFRNYFNKYISCYLKCENISLKYKLSVILFYYFPCAYEAYRKKTDSTL